MFHIRFGTARQRRPIVYGRITYDRIITPRFTHDTEASRTWNMNIRQILADNSVRDTIDERNEFEARLLGRVADVPREIPDPESPGPSMSEFGVGSLVAAQ